MKTNLISIVILICCFSKILGQNPALNIDSGPYDLNLKTNGFTRLNIINDGFVGIGTRPYAKLHVYKGHSAATANNESVGIFENNNNAYITILSPSSSYVGLLFNSPGSAASITYSHEFKDFEISTHGSQKMKISANGNFGIGTTSPDAKLDVNGDFVLSKILTVPPGDYNNLNRNGSSVIHFYKSSPSNYTLSGLLGGVDGMIVHIYAGAGQNLTILNNSVLSDSPNRILSNNNANILINGGGATLMYMNTIWRVIGVAL